MRLLGLTVEGFRGFNRRQYVDINADVALVFGDNGSCKTSLFDAIQWCLYGKVERLGGTRDFVGVDPVRNVFTDKGPFVSLRLHHETAGEITFARQGLTATRSWLTLSTESSIFEGKEAETRVKAIIPSNFFNAIGYLAQETLSKFITESPRQRFNIISRIFGLNLISEFYKALDLEAGQLKDQLTKASNDIRTIEAKIEGEGLSIQNRIDSLVKRLGDAETTIKPDLLQDQWKGTVKEASSLAELAEPVFTFTQGTLSRDLREVREIVVGLRSKRQQLERESGDIHSLLRRIPQLAEEIKKLENLKNAKQNILDSIQETKSRLTEYDKSLELVKEKLAEIKNDISAEETRTDETVRFLELALGQVKGKSCPVCGQSISVSHVRDEIETRIGKAGRKIGILKGRERSSIAERHRVESIRKELRRVLSTKKTERTSLEDQIRELESRIAEYPLEDTKALNPKALNELENQLYMRLEPIEGRADRISKLLPEMDKLEAALDLAVAKLDLERTSKRNEEALHHADELKNKEQKLKEIMSTVKSASRASKRREVDVIEKVIHESRILLNELYRRLEPHPLFQDLSARFDTIDSGGEVYFDVRYREIEANVHVVLSQAQLNVVALSIFLALNMARREFDYPILLDDPVQSMDDLNASALADLLRYARRNGQLILSTHNIEFFEMLSERLRPSTPSEKQLRFVFKTGDTSGPVIESELVQYTPAPSLKQLALPHAVSS